MNRSFTVALAGIILSAACVSQVHGIPVSVTSPRNGGDAFPSPRGIPASIGSLGPEGLGFASANFVPTSSLRRDRVGRPIALAPIPLFYNVPYYPVVYVPTQELSSSYVQRVVEDSAVKGEPQRIILEIRDTRAPAAPAVAAKEIVPEPKPASRLEVESPRVATVFVFQDGSRKELKDFAITADELIDLSEGLIRRAPLALLDRAATLKVNAENGVELHFPSSSSD